MAPGHAARIAVAVALVVAVALAVTGCGEDDGAGGGGDGEVAVLLPDRPPNSRWESLDRPFLKAAFDAAGVEVTFRNADRDAVTQQQQAEAAIAEGADVLLLVNLDSGSGATIAADAQAAGVDVVDYDRLTLDSESDYYVSFDGEEVGRLQGEGLVRCLEEQGVQKPRVAVLNGSPTDHNATLFKRGYDGVAEPRFEAGEWTEVADEYVPEWDAAQARVIFERMLGDDGAELDGVLAANDGLAAVVIDVLRRRGLDPVPVTGQDATPQALRSILAGHQCMTVYKAIKKEADAAAKVAVALARGEKPGAPDRVDNGAKRVPAVLLEPVAVTRETIADHVGEPGFPDVAEICAGRLARACEEAGL